MSSLLLTCALFAQKTALQGTIFDEKHQAIAFANMLLLKGPDSTFVKAAISENDGTFIFSDLDTGHYLLRSTFLGYHDFFIAIHYSGTNIYLPDINLRTEAQILNTAVVVAKKPFLEQRAGAMVVNVANSITGTSGSVIDVLKKVPGMIIVNNQISLAGQKGLSILIDGRPTQYMDVQSLLRDMPAANIDRIEVITQPGARFDAQGTGAVINIILKRNLKLGFNGTATIGAGMGRFAKYRSSGVLNYRNGKINFSNSIAFNHRTSYEQLNLDRIVGTETYSQTNFQPNLPYSLNLKSGLDYYLTDRQTVGVNVNVLGSSNRSVQKNRTYIFTDAGRENARSELLTNNTLNRQWGFVNLDAYYELKLDTSGQKLNVDVSFNKYGRDMSYQLNTNVLKGDQSYPDRLQLLPGNTFIQAYKLDYTKPFGKTFKFETGLKYSKASIDNDLRSSVGKEDVFVADPGLSNHFIFSENIGAAYASAVYNKGKWEVQAGLRYENSLSTGYSITLDSTQTRHISRLFPSLSISAPLSGKLGWSMAYSNRVNRPSYNSLNPFIRFLDPYTYEKGNPFLRPEFSHTYKLSLTFDKQPFFNLEYARTNNSMQLVVDQDPKTGIGFSTEQNLSTFVHYGGSLFFPLEFVKNLSGYGGFMLYYNKYTSQVFQELYNQGRWNLVGFIQATYQLPKGWKLEANGWYNGPGIEGIQITKYLYSVSLGAQKKMWKDRATLNISADDMLFRYFRGSINHANFNANIISSWETKIVNVSFTYNFGNLTLKKTDRHGSGASEEKQRTNEK
jgi:hypothetical protein